jgi:hypothetical protein
MSEGLKGVVVHGPLRGLLGGLLVVQAQRRGLLEFTMCLSVATSSTWRSSVLDGASHLSDMVC